MAVPTSTYRLQITAEFDLYAAADVCDYLATLGVGTVYLSPLLPSTHGSDHGYDVIGFDTVDPQRGGLDGWTRLLAAARARQLTIVVDIVPNHTGVADAHQNPAWWDYLRLGPDSAHAAWFDVDRAAAGGRVLLPVLGDDFEDAQLEVVDTDDGAELRYFEHRFPVAPGTEGGSPVEVHARQSYQVVNFRRADTEQNYRRFFAVSDLAGVRVEDEAVFDATHQQIARWLRDDGIAGLRVDHPDGLADPVGYVHRLRALAGDDAWLVVEKILEHGEQLPADWPVDGTTGYDALNEIGGVFVDPAGEAPLDALYRSLTSDALDSAAHIDEGKRFVMDTILQAEVSRIARLAPEVDGARDALRELVAAFAFYRTYLPLGSENLTAAVDAARAARPDLADAIDALAPRLSDPADELAVRFPQVTGAVMAKGVEDTAFYRYARFVSLNEVGGDPSAFGIPPTDFHAAQAQRQRDWPNTMTTLTTHDTKRGEDLRARLDVISELPDEWSSLISELMTAVPLADRPLAYLLWQTLAGMGFVERQRVQDYAEKAMREAAVSTGWIDPDETFEAGVHALIDRAYDDPAVHSPLAAFVERITPFGWSNALGQKLVQLCSPGVPDVYQGSELWEDSLVDPDNRRPVDYAARRSLLTAMDGDGATPPPVDASGAAKLWVVSRTLRLRRERAELFAAYTPVTAVGSAADHLLGFDRGGATCLVTRLPVGLEAAGGWGDTSVQVEGTDVLTGRSYSGPTAVADLFATYPVALLAR